MENNANNKTNIKNSPDFRVLIAHSKQIKPYFISGFRCNKDFVELALDEIRRLMMIIHKGRKFFAILNYNKEDLNFYLNNLDMQEQDIELIDKVFDYYNKELLSGVNVRDLYMPEQFFDIVSKFFKEYTGLSIDITTTHNVEDWMLNWDIIYDAVIISPDILWDDGINLEGYSYHSLKSLKNIKKNIYDIIDEWDLSDDVKHESVNYAMELYPGLFLAEALEHSGLEWKLFEDVNLGSVLVSTRDIWNIGYEINDGRFGSPKEYPVVAVSREPCLSIKNQELIRLENYQRLAGIKDVRISDRPCTLIHRIITPPYYKVSDRIIIGDKNSPIAWVRAIMDAVGLNLEELYKKISKEDTQRCSIRR